MAEVTLSTRKQASEAERIERAEQKVQTATERQEHQRKVMSVIKRAPRKENDYRD